MPDNLESLPLVLQNKPEEQKQTYVRAYKAALSKGLTEDEAQTSGLLAVQAFVRKSSIVKQKETLKRPSHVPTKEMIEALRKEQGQKLIEEEIRKQVVVPSGFTALPQGKERNVIAANFDDKDRLVIIFDTGERLTTRSVNIKEYVEQFISVNNGASTPTTGVIEVVAGDNVTVDNTDPQRPIVSASGGGGTPIAGDNPVFIQDTQPVYDGKYIWIQTNIDDNPDSFTFWFEDGV